MPIVLQSLLTVSCATGIKHSTRSSGLSCSSTTTTPLTAQSASVTPELKNHRAWSICTPPSLNRAVQILACGTLASRTSAPAANTSRCPSGGKIPTWKADELEIAVTHAVAGQPLASSAITSTYSDMVSA
ncbi:hypothetical protein BKG61_13325 [Mycobacterium syngnathidarum]|uniref:Uncharacterized protein n=1 Tax=Mycobacterium syngnathidarum TaxID=1908205 RepID=A0A1S1K412_9MYCO|nr:hypothetical protein BKG61_13325 [Mycobacterium syngnathidarum]